MKLSKLFHSLYAMVMFLPIFIIPIFALNILHKETEPISIEVQEKISVDFNQFVDYTTLPNRVAENITYTNNNNGSLTASGTSSGYSDYTIKTINGLGHIWYIRSGTSNNIVETRLTSVGGAYNEYRGFVNVQSAFYLRILPNTSVNDLYLIPQIYDLTQMFGSGNEPTIEEFNLMFPNPYYEYTTSHKMLVNKPTTTTFNSTDIGSQFVYALYKPVHDYFNFGDFFGLGGMYDWFQLNIFNGTSPLTFFIVFNVMIYWLFISLFWLIFDVLMYVPNMIHKMLDKARLE